ncbi:methionyl-tRNA formyltransferase [Sulfurirhabdus autotrophica]|uniref:Methionyl-tRNA formyltransferase n=2 Tax=Sulfurirhabdus autotrophica TaxID=1706046 RepID=A0A4R3XYS5_9PROT|nr:methionyl-tRNA formyltransferase [Sulfurirhabdus autotrophica]
MVERLGALTGRDFRLITTPGELTVEKLAPINPEFIFFPHWSHHIDSGIYEQFECVIFHMTDLPFGRGGSPLQNLIARGIYETKISALRCVEEMDAGSIYLKRLFSLYGSAEEIFIRASSVIEDMIAEILQKLPEPKPQEGEPTVFKRRRPEDGDLATAQSLEQMFDQIRMLDAEGYPNAFLNIGPFKFEFTRASQKVGQIMADVRVTLVDNVKERDN